MKKLILTSAFFLLVASASTLQAETSRDWAISGHIGTVDFKSDERPDPYFRGLTHTIDSDNAIKVGVTVSRYYHDFSFDLGLEYIEEVAAISDGRDELGKHSHVPIHIAANYHFNLGVVNPYVGVGIGYSFNDESASAFITDQGMSAEGDDSIFYLAKLGLEHPINDNYSVFAEGIYKKMEIEGEVTFMGRSLDVEADNDSYEYSVGVRYFF